MSEEKLKMEVVDEEESEEMESKPTPSSSKVEKQVYLPGKPLEEGEELVCDESAYILLRHWQTGSPCLTFDIIPDELGSNRSTFPLTCYLAAGTQAPTQKDNKILVMKMSNINKTQVADSEDDEEDSEDEEDEDRRPNLEHVYIAHYGCINRIRNTTYNNTILTATWSEMGRVSIWDLKKQIQALEDPRLLTKYVQDGEAAKTKPIFTFSGHQQEGFAIDWCTTVPGMLASGDCRRNIHVWNPDPTGWKVDQRSLVGHTDSVEDLQWSPNERHVLSSCSVDKSVRIWDTRAPPDKACMITVDNAHQSDVNVINWNKNEPFIVSGGDDGCVHVWDLRRCKSRTPVATFKHHTGPVCSVEWHPKEGSVFASGGSDNQIALWDLSVEKDDEVAGDDIEELPPQLLFIHQGQKDIKELHWHPQLPGVMISTALSGFNIFRTISV